jgi:hypothetical protein
MRAVEASDAEVKDPRPQPRAVVARHGNAAGGDLAEGPGLKIDRVPRH